ncbi:MAG: M48 family metallopeptidase [Neisseria sp.]|nr:M48 family metallopeptidase [Neisseria sp.]
METTENKQPFAAADYFDGRSNRAYPAQLSLANGQLRVCYEGKTAVYALSDAEYLAAVGSVPPALELPDDARIVFSDGLIPEWLPLKNKTLLKKVGLWERSWKWVAAALLIMVLAVFAAFRWGIPAASYYAAHSLPETTLNGIGRQAEEMVVQLTDETRLSNRRRQEIAALYGRLKTDKPAKLLFREGKNIGANAFAIPNNTIVVTDELVKLAANDQEILAVLAHEQGHLAHRHSLQQALRGLGVGVLMLTLTGDGTDLLDNLPVLLATAQYSQAFELEADLYAVQSLQRLGIKPQYLADFLLRLDKQSGEEEGGSNLLGSHPLTSERVKQIERYAQ